MRKSLAAVVAVGALVTPPTAAAKEVSSMKLCGPAGCTTLTDRSVISPIVMFSGQPTRMAPPAPGPYYRVTFQVEEPGHGIVGGFDTWWVASAAEIRGSDEAGTPFWYALTDAQQAYIRDGTKNLTPFAAPRLTRVLVGNRAVRDPNSYLALLHQQWPAATRYASDWKPVTITATQRNPWTDRVIVLYSPKTNSLWRAAERLHVPGRIAANVEARRSLTATGGNSFAWAWVVGAAAIVGLAGSVVHRRR